MTVRDSLRILNDVGGNTVRADYAEANSGIERFPQRRHGKLTGERLNGIRISYGYALDEVSEKIGISSHTLRNAERGMAVGRKVLAKLAQLYGVSVDWLCGMEGK